MSENRTAQDTMDSFGDANTSSTNSDTVSTDSGSAGNSSNENDPLSMATPQSPVQTEDSPNIDSKQDETSASDRELRDV